MYIPSYCQKRCISLRDQYNREKRKADIESKSGSAATKAIRFPFFSQLSFLDHVIKRRGSYTNCTKFQPSIVDEDSITYESQSVASISSNEENESQLVEMAKPYLTKKSPRALNPELRLLITLRYLATGDLPFTIALAFRVGESTVREVVKEVCLVLIKVLEPLYLSSPTEEDWTKCAHGYWRRWNIPNCVGSVNGKHVRLRCPLNSGSLYFNYKKFYSIVLLAVADHLYRFTLVDIGAYGRNSDGGIFNECDIGINLNNNRLNLPKEPMNLPNSNLETYTYFVADDAFKLSKRIMKPYSSKNLIYKQKIFNYQLSRARRTVESAFGIFSNKWRIFQTAISMLPETADLIVTASVCLHHYILKEEQRSGLKMYNQEQISNNNANQDLPWISVPNVLEEDNDVRTAETQRNILSDYFVSEAGKVEWQHDYVQRGIHADE